MSTASAQVGLPTQVRNPDGSVFTGELDPVRHRRIQLGMLHGHHAGGYVELCPGTRPPGGKVEIDRRKQPTHYLPLGVDGWLDAALEHVQEILDGKHPSPNRKLRFKPRREEVFVGVTARTERKGQKAYIAHSDWLWVDVDEPDELPKLWGLLQRRPAHLVVLSGGSGGAHAYWRLDRPLPAHTPDPETGEAVEWIERANQRLIHHLGHWTTPTDGSKSKFVGADRSCADRSRVMRLAGTQNGKTGAYARIAWADFWLAPYAVTALVGDLDDMPGGKATPLRGAPRNDARGKARGPDPYKRIAPSTYFARLAGVEVPQYGLVSCPSPDHEDRHPSLKVGSDATEGWYCLGGETRILTLQGAREIGDLVGTTHKLLTTGGRWVDAPIGSFGEQRLRRMVLSRNGVEKEVFATPEHRWFIRRGARGDRKVERVTDTLRPGDRLVSVFPRVTPEYAGVRPSPFGIARGIVVGDGTRLKRGSTANLHGAEDQELLRYFPLSHTYLHRPSVATVVTDLPAYWKDEVATREESASYRYGWLAGYFAADGDVGRGISLNSADREHSEIARAICQRLGIGTFGIPTCRRKGYSSPGRKNEIHRLRLMRPGLTPEFFVLSEHRRRFETTQPAHTCTSWVVKSVEATSRVEEVFCATVDGTHTFALEDNILTGNCHTCSQGGGIYDLASFIRGGPTGRDLRGEEFKRALARVTEVFGEQ